MAKTKNAVYYALSKISFEFWIMVLRFLLCVLSYKFYYIIQYIIFTYYSLHITCYCILYEIRFTRYKIQIYFVPNSLSPASPNPGTIYPWEFNLSSTAAVYIFTSGWYFCNISIPSGAAIIHINFISSVPHFLI